MKRRYFFLLFFLIMILPGAWHTQDKVTTVDSLVVDIWPDYDRASVLVLLTGTLLADTKLPASVTLPFPETGRLNAVARIDSSDGVMKNDIIYTTAPGEIAFIVPDLRFRVEYYLPYTVNNNRRTFNFTWLADVSVDNFQIRVQQPKFASSLTTVPGTLDVASSGDGFTYHAFPIKSVRAGQIYSVDVEYTMTSTQLSIAKSAPTGAQESVLPSTSKGKLGVKWLIVVVVVSVIILLIVIIWQMSNRRAEVNRQVSHQAKSATDSSLSFCAKCGNQVDKADKFCSKCGSALKGK
ncbi:MAG: zinc ribbon domain-containing protein [Deltaproteobacteria bacterium]|nr:zinc ribbon domain-containing protein [Deltaproteobacteria bacterium]